MRMFLACLLVGFLGAASLVTGVAGLLDTEVACGGRVISPGETCTTYEKYQPVVRDYQGQKASEDLVSSTEVGLGALLLLFPTVALIGFWRHRRRGLPNPTERQEMPEGLEKWASRRARRSPFHR